MGGNGVVFKKRRQDLGRSEILQKCSEEKKFPGTLCTALDLQLAPSNEPKLEV